MGSEHLSSDSSRVILKSRPKGQLDRRHFAIDRAPMPKVGDGDVLVRNIYSSVEPYLRILLERDTGHSRRFEIGDVIPARVVGEVVESRHTDYGKGDFVFGMLNWESFSLVREGAGLHRVDASLAPLSYYLGVLGTTGLTAYIGMLDIGAPVADETVYVSAAAGAVGHLAGQLAKMQGARVIGSTGSDDKVAFLRNLGFDGAFNYKNEPSVAEALAENCPDGIDLDFENVGGANLEAVLDRINEGARIVLCGLVSQYGESQPYGVRNLEQLQFNRARIQGFSVRDHMERLPGYIEEMSGWLKEGRIQYRENIVRGLEYAPDALTDLLAGRNIGKQILQIGDDPVRA